jgi:hypothetical protein
MTPWSTARRFSVLLVVVALGCADEGDGGADITLGGAGEDAGKDDSLAGKTVRIDPRAYVDQVRQDDPAVLELGATTTVKMRTDKRLTMIGEGLGFDLSSSYEDAGRTCDEEADCADLPGGICSDGGSCFEIRGPEGTMTVELATPIDGVEMGFLFFDVARFTGYANAPILKCAGQDVFRSLAIDFDSRTITVDGRTPHSFKDCGLRVGDPEYMDWYGAFAVPTLDLRPAAGRGFAGAYPHVYRIERQ